jgi:hypothetical protein
MQVLRSAGFAVVIASLGLFSGCVEMAYLDDLPDSNAAIHYGEIEKKHSRHYEHEFALKHVSEDQLVKATEQALSSNGYIVRKNDRQSGVITAERGMRANEWGSVAGVYYMRRNDGLSVKVIVEISQDFTGTFPQKYAENIAVRIRNVLHQDTGLPADAL